MQRFLSVSSYNRVKSDEMLKQNIEAKASSKRGQRKYAAATYALNLAVTNIVLLVGIYRNGKDK